MAQSILEGSFILNSGVTKTYYIAVWISETNNDQLTNDTGSYGGIVRITSALGEGLTAKFGDLPELASTYIQNLYNDGSDITTVNIGGDTSNPEVSLNSTQSIMLDNNGEYRYYGASPNNYVSFNNELWRIISVSNVKSSINDTSGEQRIKLIRDTKIGDHDWDDWSEYDVGYDYWSNDWTDSTLMCQLNTLYYNDSIETCSSKTFESLSTSLTNASISLIDDTLWYLGGCGGDVCMESYADDYYNFEREGKVAEESFPSKWVGKVGIMYSSDYAYATDLNVCKSYGYDYDIYTSSCVTTNWLYKEDYEWLISSNSERKISPLIVEELGFIDYGEQGGIDDASYDLPVRPVVYLKSDVIITGGTGTSTNPYTLA